MKPYYDHAGVQIFHGDAREVLPLLDLAAFGVVVMDPPYGIRHSSGHGASWQGTEIAGDHSTELRDWAAAALSPLPMFVFGTWKAPRPADTRAVLIWDKGPASGMGDVSFPWKGSFEEIYVIGSGFTGSRDEGVIKGHLVPTWETKGRRHPHQKPETLVKYLLRKSPSGAALDPFMGSGTTLRAAKDSGRRAVGIEIEERHCEIAAKRLSQGVFDFAPAAEGV